MFSQRWTGTAIGALTGAIFVALLAAAPSRADQASDASATVRLIQLLIEKGILTQDQAASLLKQAQDESRQQHKPTPRPAVAHAAPRAPRPAAAATTAVAATPPKEPVVPPGTVRVTYVPQIVRDQIAQQVRQEVMQQAQAENWAAPNPAADWTKHIHVYGDVRMRGERAFEDHGNGPLPDFNSINSGAGFDTTNGGSLPSINTLEDRTRFRLRARIGVAAQIDDWVSTDFLLATGNDNSPVSTNQTLGSGGDFSKYALWLDRAYILLEPFKSAGPAESLKIYVGREPNPFWTTDLVYASEVNFDGAAVTGNYAVSDKLNVFASAGAFTVFNTDFNFSSLNTTKYPSHDKYLFAGQAGVELKPLPATTAKFAAGFFAYTNIDGTLSPPCTITVADPGCPTDDTRAQYVQYGNTLFPIRNVVVTGTSTATPEYFGLASRFDILDLHGRVDYAGFAEPVALEGEFSKNFGFNRKVVASRNPVNNLAANSGEFAGGDTAYMAKLTVGKPDVAEKWEWNTFIAYKYLESDSVLDALTDSDFHLGGTNAKGFIVGGDLGLAHNLYLAGRWYSATQVSGTPYSNDLVQVDLNARF